MMWYLIWRRQEALFLTVLKTGGVFYRSVKNRVNTATIHYIKKNQTGFRAGKILNCVLNAAGGAKLYLTFVAKDFNTGDVREFQACVHESAAGGDRKVYLCRLKIPKVPS